MKLKPLFARVLVEGLDDAAKVTKSGIVLPDAEKKKQSKGVVVAVGDGRPNDKGGVTPMTVKVGDKVLFKEPWSEESKFESEGKKLFLVDEDDVLALIEE